MHSGLKGSPFPFRVVKIRPDTTESIQVSNFWVHWRSKHIKHDNLVFSRAHLVGPGARQARSGIHISSCCGTPRLDPDDDGARQDRKNISTRMLVMWLEVVAVRCVRLVVLGWLF